MDKDMFFRGAKIAGSIVLTLFVACILKGCGGGCNADDLPNEDGVERERFDMVVNTDGSQVCTCTLAIKGNGGKVHYYQGFIQVNTPCEDPATVDKAGTKYCEARDLTECLVLPAPQSVCLPSHQQCTVMNDGPDPDPVPNPPQPGETSTGNGGSGGGASNSDSSE